MKIIFIALGSNLGDRQQHLKSAQEELKKILIDVKASPIYETSPCYEIHQPDFLNQVICGYLCDENLSPENLLHILKNIEIKMGRIPSYRNGPRCIDLDLLFFENEIQSSDLLTIPHPRLYERLFVLEPLCDLAPHFLCPITGKPMQSFLDELKNTSH